jgi:hypothetical protein
MKRFPHLEAEAFVARIADNSGLAIHRAGYNGMASLILWHSGWRRVTQTSSLTLVFHDANVTSEAGWIAYRELDEPPGLQPRWMNSLAIPKREESLEAQSDLCATC